VRGATTFVPSHCLCFGDQRPPPPSDRTAALNSL
jgi:hypothetical protein